MKKTGVLILVAGLLITVFTGFHFVTKKKVVDVGNLEISQHKNHVLTWSPFIGVAVMVVGGVVLFYSAKTK